VFIFGALAMDFFLRAPPAVHYIFFCLHALSSKENIAASKKGCRYHRGYVEDFSFLQEINDS